MSVKTALQLINRFLAEDDFDADTQFCLHWFEQHGWTEGVFGDADVLARAKATSVDGHEGSRRVVKAAAARCVCGSSASTPRLGSAHRQAAARLGGTAPAHPAPDARTANPPPAQLLGALRQQEPRPSASSPTASTPSANAKAGPKTPAPTTSSSPSWTGIESAAASIPEPAQETYLANPQSY